MQYANQCVTYNSVLVRVSGNYSLMMEFTGGVNKLAGLIHSRSVEGYFNNQRTAFAWF